MPIYELTQNGQHVLSGNDCHVSEKIEAMLQERLGFFVSLQPYTDDDEYNFYLHTDNEDILTEEQLNMLDEEYGINTHDEENAELQIKQLLNIDVKEV